MDKVLDSIAAKKLSLWLSFIVAAIAGGQMMPGLACLVAMVIIFAALMLIRWFSRIEARARL